MVQKLKNDKKRDDSLLFSWAQFHLLKRTVIVVLGVTPETLVSQKCCLRHAGDKPCRRTTN